MHLRNRTVPHLQGPYSHLVYPPSLPQGLLCHIMDSQFSLMTLTGSSSPFPRLHTCSVLPNIITPPSLRAVLSCWFLIFPLPSSSNFWYKYTVFWYRNQYASGIFLQLCLHSGTHQRCSCICISLELACCFFHCYLYTIFCQFFMTSVCCVSSWKISTIRWQTSYIQMLCLTHLNVLQYLL